MAETNTAESSTAGIETLSPEERQKWRMSGELPERKPAASEEPKKEPEASAASETQEIEETPSESPADESQGPKAAPESETGATQDKSRKQSPAEKRIKQLLAQRKADERRIQELEGQLAASPRNAAPPKAEEKTAATEARPKPQPQDKNADGTPKYANYEEFLDDRADWIAEQKIAARMSERDKTETERAAKAKAEQQQAAVTNDWKGKVEKGREKYADFDEVALNEDLPIKVGSVVDVAILTSPHGTDVLYYLGQHPEELDEINAMPPMDAARALFRIETSLSGNGNTPGRKVSQAPPPVREVGGRGAAPADEVTSAVNKGDFASYRSAANRREIALRKG